MNKRLLTLLIVGLAPLFANANQMTTEQAVATLNLYFNSPFTGESFTHVGPDPEKKGSALIYDWSYSSLISVNEGFFVRSVTALTEADQMSSLSYDRVLEREFSGTRVSKQQSEATRVPYKANIYASQPLTQQNCAAQKKSFEGQYDAKTMWKANKRLIIACSALANRIFNESAEFPSSFFQATESRDVGSGRYSPSTGIIFLEIETPWTVELHEKFHALQLVLSEVGEEFALHNLLKAGAYIEVDAILATEVIIPQQLRKSGLKIEKGELEKYIEEAGFENIESVRAHLVDIYLNPQKAYPQIKKGNWGEYWKVQLAPLYRQSQAKYFEVVKQHQEKRGRQIDLFSTLLPGVKLGELVKANGEFLAGQRAASEPEVLDKVNRLQQLQVRARYAATLLRQNYVAKSLNESAKSLYLRAGGELLKFKEQVQNAIERGQFASLPKHYHNLRMIEEKVSELIDQSE